MYAYVKGEDEHLCFKWFKSRKEAEEWIEKELFLYSICYDVEPDYSVITNKQFYEIFTDEKQRKSSSWRRLGNRLRQRIDEQRKMNGIFKS